MDLKLEMSMSSSMTETVCDFPEPWTPQTIAEKGAFYKSCEFLSFVIGVFTHGVQIQQWIVNSFRFSLVPNEMNF